MSAFTRISPMLRQRLFSTSTRARTAISIQDVTAAQLSSATSTIPRIGKVAKWYLPTMAAIALGFGITNALNDANRQVHQAQEPTQEQRNLMLMDLYGERSSLADMERAMAGLEKRLTTQTQRNKALEDAYGDRASIKDLQRAMQLYEVQ